MAQLVEHVIGNDEVISSTLIASSRTRTAIAVRVLCFKREFQHLHPDSCACADSSACEGQRFTVDPVSAAEIRQIGDTSCVFRAFSLCVTVVYPACGWAKSHGIRQPQRLQGRIEEIPFAIETEKNSWKADCASVWWSVGDSNP